MPGLQRAWYSASNEEDDCEPTFGVSNWREVDLPFEVSFAQNIEGKMRHAQSVLVRCERIPAVSNPMADPEPTVDDYCECACK